MGFRTWAIVIVLVVLGAVAYVFRAQIFSDTESTDTPKQSQTSGSDFHL